MIVCMFGSSLAVAPAYVLALDGADFINIEVPKSGWDKTNPIGIKIIVKAIKILISELIFSIFTLW